MEDFQLCGEHAPRRGGGGGASGGGVLGVGMRGGDGGGVWPRGSSVGTKFDCRLRWERVRKEMSKQHRSMHLLACEKVFTKSCVEFTKSLSWYCFPPCNSCT